jgi:hypothetical protein
MLRCTIRISSYDLTHHSIIPYRNNHAISSDVATLQTTSLSYQIIPPPSRRFLRVFQRLPLSVAQFLQHHQESSSIIPKYFRTFLRRDRWYIPSLLGSTLPSSLSTGKTLPISLDYMISCMLLHARSRDLLSCRRQALGVVEYSLKCLGDSMWRVACGVWLVAGSVYWLML